MTAPANEPKSKGAEHDWSKTITAIGGLTVAVATLLTALHTIGVIGAKEPTPKPTVAVAAIVQPTETPTPHLKVLEDDFSNPESGWDRGADLDAEWGYEDGEYRIVVHATDTTVWANTRTRYDLANLIMVVEARRVAGPLDNQYGVIVRYQDRSNFYLFVVSSDGLYAVQKLQDDKWKDLVSWTPSPAIRVDDGANLLRVEARGPEMRFWVNGELLCVVEDSAIGSGSIGLAAGAFAEPGVEVRFDNLLVRQLP